MKFCFFIFFHCICIGLISGEGPSEKKKTVCLNMIVKNEASVIRRCLDSVSPLIDYWVIVDTGSGDGTQKLIIEHMKQIPGELHERPWVNFGHNRNEALQLAKGKADYILFIDADEILAYDKGYQWPVLDKDFYHIMTHFGGTTYARVQLIKDSLNWQWKGVLHETVIASAARTNEILEGIFNQVHTDGARSLDPDKYKKDAQLLEKALLEEPDNTRYVFYLAQSYKDAGDHESSLKNYQKRAEMGGWEEEVFWSLFQIGAMNQSLHKNEDTVAGALIKAYHFRPSRIEPLYQLANYYRVKGNYVSGYLIASIAAKIPMSRDILFVQKWMYDYGILLELSVCSYWIGKYEECVQVSQKILAIPGLPQNIRECVERNLALASSKLLEIYNEVGLKV